MKIGQPARRYLRAVARYFRKALEAARRTELEAPAAASLPVAAQLSRGRGPRAARTRRRRPVRPA